MTDQNPNSPDASVSAHAARSAAMAGDAKVPHIRLRITRREAHPLTSEDLHVEVIVDRDVPDDMVHRITKDMVTTMRRKIVAETKELPPDLAALRLQRALAAHGVRISDGIALAVAKEIGG
jgi:hypothetical protein